MSQNRFYNRIPSPPGGGYDYSILVLLVFLFMLVLLHKTTVAGESRLSDEIYAAVLGAIVGGLMTFAIEIIRRRSDRERLEDERTHRRGVEAELSVQTAIAHDSKQQLQTILAGLVKGGVIKVDRDPEGRWVVVWHGDAADLRIPPRSLSTVSEYKPPRAGGGLIGDSSTPST